MKFTTTSMQSIQDRIMLKLQLEKMLPFLQTILMKWE